MSKLLVLRAYFQCVLEGLISLLGGSLWPEEEARGVTLWIRENGTNESNPEIQPMLIHLSTTRGGAQLSNDQEP